jgi:hypothetical protein
MKRFKWHILPLVRAIICGKGRQPLNSRKIERDCEKITKALGQHGAGATEVFPSAVEVCRKMDNVTADQLKRQAVLPKMLEKLS